MWRDFGWNVLLDKRGTVGALADAASMKQGLLISKDKRNKNAKAEEKTYVFLQKRWKVKKVELSSDQTFFYKPLK